MDIATLADLNAIKSEIAELKKWISALEKRADAIQAKIRNVEDQHAKG